MKQRKANRNIVASVMLGLIMAGQACAVQDDVGLLSESKRIVSQHKAVFDKIPAGLAPYSTDAVLLGNGDIAMSISTTPLEKGSAIKKQEPGKIRFWFHKNDMWDRSSARSVALIEEPEPICKLEGS